VKEACDIRAVLRGGHGVWSHDRLVSDERFTAHHTSAHTAQLRNLIAEGVSRPFASAVPKRRVDVPMLVAREKRYLEPDTIALVTRVTVLTRRRAMEPRTIKQERTHSSNVR